MHVDLTPNISLIDVQTSLLALAGEFRGQHLDWGCRTKAVGVATAYAGQVMPHDPPLIGDCPDCPDDESKAALLEKAAATLASKGAGFGDADAVPWTLILTIIAALIERFRPKS